jgi:hypothetical protein
MKGDPCSGQSTGSTQKSTDARSKIQKINIPRSAIEQLSIFLMNRLKGSSSYQAEAQYYLETTNYDLKKAIEEFEADLKFE